MTKDSDDGGECVVFSVYGRKNGSCAVLYGIMMKMLRRLLFSYWTASFFPFFIKKIHLG